MKVPWRGGGDGGRKQERCELVDKCKCWRGGGAEKRSQPYG